MRLIFALLFNPWGRVALGVLLISLASGLVIGSQMPLPERADLKRVAGTADQATRTTVAHSESGTYTLDISSANGATVIVDMPDGNVITGNQVKSLLGRQVVALVKDRPGHQDVWELSADGKPVITYEQVRQHEVETLQNLATAAPYVGGAGVVMVVAGIVGAVRRRRGKKVAA